MSVHAWRLLAAALLVAGLAPATMFALNRGGPADRDEPPDPRTLRTLGDRLRPLHRKKLPPRPGEWLDQHKEAGQTFSQYLKADPNRPTARRHTLYVQSIGSFTATQKRLVAATTELLGLFYNVPVKTLDPLGFETIPVSAQRVHPTWGGRQVLSTCIREVLETRRPDDAVAVIALTTSDLWPGEGWNFVFGEASLRKRVGVWSLHQLGNPETEYATTLLRTLKTAVHETGHMFTIQHCTAYECGMNGSNHLPEADSQPLGFCPEDEMKVWWACRFDPKTRYERLAEFAERHHLVDEARAWRAALAAVDPPARTMGRATNP
jgi:archaemetzincin